MSNMRLFMSFHSLWEPTPKIIVHLRCFPQSQSWHGGFQGSRGQQDLAGGHARQHNGSDVAIVIKFLPHGTPFHVLSLSCWHDYRGFTQVPTMSGMRLSFSLKHVQKLIYVHLRYFPQSQSRPGGFQGSRGQQDLAWGHARQHNGSD